MSMTAIEFVDHINHKVERFVNKLEFTNADKLGLDRRAGYSIYIDVDRTCIVVKKYDDRVLQYYGGFEYIDKEFRYELGDYVFYSRDAERVDMCFNRLEESESESDIDDGA